MTIHRLCRDTGVTATEALQLAEDRPICRTITIRREVSAERYAQDDDDDAHALLLNKSVSRSEKNYRSVSLPSHCVQRQNNQTDRDVFYTTIQIQYNDAWWVITSRCGPSSAAFWTVSQRSSRLITTNRRRHVWVWEFKDHDDIDHISSRSRPSELMKFMKRRTTAHRARTHLKESY